MSAFQLSEGALLAAAPIVGTYLAYVFQWSYLGFFGVPSSLIEIDLPKIIASITAITCAAVVFSALLAFGYDFVLSKNVFLRIVGKWIVGAIVFSPFIVGSFQVYSATELAIYAVILLVLGLTSFIPPSQKPGESLSYWERLERQQKLNDELDVSPPTTVRQLFGSKILGPFSLVVFGSLYVSVLGHYFAAKGETHRVLNEQPDFLYVAKSGDSYIFAKIDLATNMLTGDIVLIGNDSDHPIAMTTKRMGQIVRRKE